MTTGTCERCGSVTRHGNAKCGICRARDRRNVVSNGYRHRGRGGRKPSHAEAVPDREVNGLVLHSRLETAADDAWLRERRVEVYARQMAASGHLDYAEAQRAE